MKSSVQDEKFSKIKSKCCALKKNIFAKPKRSKLVTINIMKKKKKYCGLNSETK